MITLIDGVPGAGKSYFLVREIALNKDKYYKIFTNINEFKFDKFDNVHPFHLTQFVDIMIKCKAIYDDDSKSDKDILEYLVSVDFLNDASDPKPVFVVIDEIHNILAKSSDLWTWVLTYHRHLFIDFLFATQDYTLIFSKYFKLFQKVYRALPNSRSFHWNSNRYQEHLKLPISDGKTGTFLRNVYIKKEDHYYELYKAGDEVRTKSVFSRFIYLFVFLAVVVVSFFFWFIYHLTGGTPEEVSSDKNSTRTYTREVRSYRSSASGKYISLNCYLDMCTNSDLHISIYVDDVQTLLEDTDSHVLSLRKLSSDHVYMYLLASSDFLELFQNRGYNNEKGLFPTR